MTASLKTASRLSWDVLHLGDEDFDAQLVKFDGWENTVCLLPAAKYKLPDDIYFEANFKMLDQFDFPYNDVSWPIISKRMFDCLKSVANFGHEAIKLGMINDLVRSKERYDRDRRFKAEVVRHDFAAIKLLSAIDVFDWDQSTYKTREQFPGFAFQIKKWTLKLPEEGFPPLFRISACPSDLFVSGAARDALNSIGVKGAEFEDVEVSN